ncbi:MAG: hypothetical protein ING75_17385 [Rhodocyclaceae bacterium]|nr:hypothetical protein [Rhodocyclaceae bacterium]
MFKTASINAQFLSRTALFSTHASGRGVNLLGWGGNEALTPEQQRDSLLARVNQITALFANNGVRKMNKFDAKRLGREKHELQMQINAIRPKTKTPGIERHVMDILREEMPKAQWDILMTRARSRLQAQEAA